MIKRNKVNWKIPKGAELTELDKKVLYFQNKGHLVPTRELIKTPEQIEGIRRAGLLNTAVLDKVAENIKEGMSTAEIDKIVYDYTTSHGGIPACLGYEGFPKLVQVARECMDIGAEAAQPFGFVGDIGHAVEKHAKKNGFSVVRDLCGHGVGLEFHEEPDVLHYGRKGTGMLLVPGMVFTIEPMINMGTWEVFIDEEDGWTVVTEDELPSAQWEHTYVMTDNGLEILTY